MKHAKQTIAKSFLILFLFPLILFSCNDTSDEPASDAALSRSVDDSLLIFSKTNGFRHESIETGQQALSILAQDEGLSVTVTEEADYFLSENFPEYDAVLFLNTDGNIFEDSHREALRAFVEDGGGFIGIHGASATEREWAWFRELIGARFANHPNDPNVFEAAIRVVDTGHPATEMLPERWVRDDEWYNFDEIPENVHVLLEMDTDSYEGSEHPGDHPIAWVHENVGGRVFYTALGHTPESYWDEYFMGHIRGGIRYVLGNE